MLAKRENAFLLPSNGLYKGKLFPLHMLKLIHFNVIFSFSRRSEIYCSKDLYVKREKIYENDFARQTEIKI